MTILIIFLIKSVKNTRKTFMDIGIQEIVT